MAARYVWPYVFNLRAAGLVGAARQQKAVPVREKFFKSNGLIPISLRWSHIPGLGFPRQPFQVYRRQRDTIEKSLYKQISAPVAVSGQQDISTFVAGDLAYIVLVPLNIAAGNSAEVQAIDNLGRPIPGQDLTLSASALAEFRCPGIAAVRITGVANVGAITAVPETAYANLDDWKKIQTVGLPLKDGEIGASYNTLPQGPEPASLDGIDAAVWRMLVTTLLQIDPPGTGIADFPLPAWPVPDPIPGNPEV